MLFYGSNLNIREALPELLKKPKGQRNWLFRILNFLAELVIDAVSGLITVLSGNKFIGDFVRIFLGVINDLVLPTIFGYEIEWQEIGQNALFRGLIFGSRLGLKHLRKIKKVNKVLGFKKVIQKAQTIARFISNPASAVNYVVNKSTYGLKKVLMKKFGKEAGIRTIKIIRNIFKFSIKATAFTSGFIAAKDKKEFLLNRLNNYGVAAIKKFSKSIIRKSVFKNLKKMKSREDLKKIMSSADKTWIDFQGASKWIDGLKIASDTWIYEETNQTLSYFVFFNKQATNYKKSLLFFNRPIEEFQNFLDAKSKGKFYLDNLAWGWEVGKAINKKSELAIKKLENTKYSEHFLSSIKEFDKNSKEVVENLKDNFKVLSSARNRFLGNKVVVEWNDNKVSFLDRRGFQTEEKYNNFFLNKQNKIKSISKPVTLVKSIKKL